MFDLNEFINTYVTKRNGSMFEQDINAHISQLEEQIGGKSILVIGGAGSIGSGFVKNILPLKPSELYVVDTNENALTELTRELRSGGGYVPGTYLSYPMDYSSVTFRRMYEAHRRENGEGGFDFVANFSAHKHVRSEKDRYSVEAMLRNNVINAKKLLDEMEAAPPSVYFCVSTDKAANPVNIMGASKRIMEDLAFSYSDSFSVKTARFANVAFSNGSLPAGFLERIHKHQPISAPLDVKRYFVSMTEAGQICMLAAALGANREIFFPKLDESQTETFDKIACELLKAHGYEVLECSSDEEAIRRMKKPDRQGGRDRLYPVHFSVSDTSGEKGFEEFYVKSETINTGRFRSLGVITGKAAPDKSAVYDLITALEETFASQSCTKDDIVKLIKGYLPNFGHLETGKSLDGKM